MFNKLVSQITHLNDPYNFISYFGDDIKTYTEKWEDTQRLVITEKTVRSKEMKDFPPHRYVHAFLYNLEDNNNDFISWFEIIPHSRSKDERLLAQIVSAIKEMKGTLESSPVVYGVPIGSVFRVQDK
jgi:hypothetical protein